MHLFILSLVLASITIINSQEEDVFIDMVQMQAKDYAYDPKVKASLDFGYRWIVNDATNKNLIPKGNFYINELYDVFMQERSSANRYWFNVDIRSMSKSRITGNFTVSYKLGEDKGNEEYDDETDYELSEEHGPQEVIAYDYDYSFQIVNGEVEEAAENTFHPIE